MKILKTSLFLLLTVLVLAGCKKKNYDTGEEFTLKFNETARINLDGQNYEIKFVELVEESRCPPDAECVSAGAVIVKIQMEQFSTYSLGLGSGLTSSLVYAEHTFRLLDVTFGKDKNYGKEKKYQIKLTVD